MATDGVQAHRGRETRLLVLVVVVSIAVLLVLARFRFPAATLAVSTPPPSPLAGLSGRAAFDDLADAMNTLLGRVSGRVTVVELGSEPRRRAGRPAGTAGTASEDAQRALALRIGPDLAVVHVPAGLHPLSFLGETSPIEIVAADSKRELALVRVPMSPEAGSEPAADAFTGFSYVGAIESTAGGPTIQPLFVGPINAVSDPRWPSPLTALSETSAASAGSFLFNVDGRLVGMLIRDRSGVSIVPASVLETAIADLTTQQRSVAP